MKTLIAALVLLGTLGNASAKSAFDKADKVAKITETERQAVADICDALYQTALTAPYKLHAKTVKGAMQVAGAECNLVSMAITGMSAVVHGNH